MQNKWSKKIMAGLVWYKFVFKIQNLERKQIVHHNM